MSGGFTVTLMVAVFTMSRCTSGGAFGASWGTGPVSGMGSDAEPPAL
jgi:hypothetical protein